MLRGEIYITGDIALDDVPYWLTAQVENWSQTVKHGEGYPHHSFSFTARAADNEDLVLGADGRWPISNIRMFLSLVRGLPKEPPKRGIGILAYNAKERAHVDIDGADESIVGWFWLPDALYDEIWGQVRENCYDTAALELQVAIVESAGPYARWDTSKKKIIPIMGASVRFERKLKPPVDPDVSRSEPPKKRGLFSRAR